MKTQYCAGLVLVLAACSGESNSGDPSDSGGAGASAGASATAGTTSSAGDGNGGAAGAGGSAADPTLPAPFTSVAQLWVGAPDDAATTVVYAFSQPVSCNLISAHGWDTKIPNGTRLVEMKEFGTAPNTYMIVTTKTPAPGEAAVNFTYSVTANATETSASGGTVTISALNATKNATGTYALTFGATHIDGAFDATYCAGGVEP